MPHSTIPMSARNLPDVIRFNAIDRYYVIPETEDDSGPYFPMALVIGIDLREALTPDQIVTALQAVNEKYPQFRLGYTLDYQHERWRKVAAADLSAHFAAMVHTDSAGDHDALVSEALR